MAVVLILVQTKQIINILVHKRNNKKKVQTIQNTVNTSSQITKTPTRYKTQTYTHPHITKHTHIHTHKIPTHTHTHKLQYPYTHPHITNKLKQPELLV